MSVSASNGSATALTPSPVFETTEAVQSRANPPPRRCPGERLAARERITQIYHRAQCDIRPFPPAAARTVPAVEPGTERTIDVVVWARDGDAVARPPELQQLTVVTDDERALPTLVENVRSRASLDVAILASEGAVVHVELLERAPGLRWSTPDVAIPSHAPWCAVGWYPATCSTIEQTLRAHGIACSGTIEQRKHWSISAILRVPTTAGDLWFKQVPGFMAHEAGVLRWLSALRPGAVPEVVAVGPDWSIMRAFPPPREEPEIDNPFGLLASLQQEAAARLDELLALGCPDRRTPSFLRDLEALADRADILEPEQRAALVDAIPALEHRCGRLDDGPVPPSLVHGDLHAGNWTRGTDGQWLIFDWTDACVAHPFVDLGLLPIRDERLREARLRSYVDTWGVGSGAAPLLRAAVPVAAGHHAVSYQRIVDGVGGDDGPSWHPPVRSFVDRMVQAVAD